MWTSLGGGRQRATSTQTRRPGGRSTVFRSRRSSSSGRHSGNRSRSHKGSASRSRRSRHIRRSCTRSSASTADRRAHPHASCTPRRRRQHQGPKPRPASSFPPSSSEMCSSTTARATQAVLRPDHSCRSRCPSRSHRDAPWSRVHSGPSTIAAAIDGRSGGRQWPERAGFDFFFAARGSFACERAPTKWCIAAIGTPLNENSPLCSCTITSRSGAIFLSCARTAARAPAPDV